jgi:hypothetical protein
VIGIILLLVGILESEAAPIGGSGQRDRRHPEAARQAGGGCGAYRRPRLRACLLKRTTFQIVIDIHSRGVAV